MCKLFSLGFLKRGKDSFVVAALCTVLRGRRGAILWTTTTRSGTCRGGLSRRRLGEGGSVRVWHSAFAWTTDRAGKCRPMSFRLPQEKGLFVHLRSKPKRISLRVMKVKEKKSTKEPVPYDPILFAVTVPSRQPTIKDRADAKEHPDDAIEPKDHATLDAAV